MKKNAIFWFKTSIPLIVCTLVFLNSCSNHKETVSIGVIPEFKVILNNNPPFQGDSIHGRQVKNVPLVLITGKNVGDKSQLELKIFNNENQVIFQSHLNPETQDSTFSHELVLQDPLINPQTASIEYDGEIYSFPIRLKKIFGKVTDNNGNPLEVYFLVNWDCDAYLRAKSEKDGTYCLWLPEEKVIHVFIDNATYGKSTLECFFGHEFVLQEDINIDINIDKMELYNMRSWASFTSFYVYFIPMSLTRANNQDFNNTKDEWPLLTNNRIKLYVNDKEISNKNLSVIKDILDFKTKASRPAYILTFDINEILDAYKASKSVVIKVTAQDSLVLNKRLFQDQGQAFLINPFYD